MDKNKINDLLGSLVKTRILARCSKYCALGRYNGEKLLVTNGTNYIGTECLVRFDSDARSLEKGLIGNFITSVIPPDFHDVSYRQYLLLANWEERMKKNGRYPTIVEINRYFDPGNLVQAYYLSLKPDGDRSVRTHIFSNGYHSSKVSTKKMLDILTIRRRTRLIIAETDYVMNSIHNNISEMGLVPILMEPLR